MFARIGWLTVVLLAGCVTTDSANPLQSWRQPARNETFDPSTLVGMQWEEAAKVIRANGWRCELTGPELATLAPEIDFARRPKPSDGSDSYRRVVVSLRNGKVVSAGKTDIL